VWQKRAGVPGVPGSTDSVSRWHNISGQVLAIYNTFAVAAKLGNSGVSIGLSASPVLHSVKTTRARNSDGSDDTLSAGSLIEGRSYLEAKGFNVGLAAGVYYAPTEKLQFGLSYTSQPGFGETKMKGTLATQFTNTEPNKTDVDFTQTYPDVLRLGGVVQAMKTLQIRTDIEFVRWSVFDKQCVVKRGEKCNVDSEGKDLSGGKVILNVPRNWKDTIAVRVGPGIWLSDQLELHGSVAFNTPAVPKSTIDASTIDGYRLDGTIGVRYEVSRHFAFDGGYTHLHYFTVNTNGENNQNIKAHPATSPGGGDYNASRSPSADGRYRSEVGLINLNAAYTF
jgi:long-chain fatty acid transport protein